MSVDAVGSGFTVPDAAWASVVASRLLGSGSTVTLIETGYGASTTRRVEIINETVRTEGDDDMTGLADIQARLLKVEDGVTTLVGKVSAIETQLNHIPTTSKMWASMGAAVLLGAGAIWAVASLVLQPAITEAIGILREIVAK